MTNISVKVMSAVQADVVAPRPTSVSTNWQMRTVPNDGAQQEKRI
jgi:hypothetical protein